MASRDLSPGAPTLGDHVLRLADLADADVVAPVRAIAFNAQTGTAYTGVLADQNKMITMSNASANTLTIPANASVAYPVGTQLHIQQLGAGATTVAITTDTLAVNANITAVLNGQYAVATALKVSATSWTLFGNLVAA